MICSICPRNCRCDRSDPSAAYCGCGTVPFVAKTMLHRWEEPCISGTAGTGAVFFSGCNLRCLFCQNHSILSGREGHTTDPEQLADLFLSLAGQGAHSISLITPTPHIPSVRKALLSAKKQGLSVPVIYNTGSYERPESLRALEGLVDLYLPDWKYLSPALSKRFSGAEDYGAAADAAIREMFRQTGHLVVSPESGLAERGVLIRHLVLPGCVHDTRAILDRILEEYGPGTALSLMRQYAPACDSLPAPLDRKLTAREYERAVAYVISLGFTRVYIQEPGCEDLSYTPDFSPS